MSHQLFSAMTDEPSHSPGAPVALNANADTGGTARRFVTIANRRGLHARAAAKFVKLAGRFACEVVVCRNGTEVCGISIMGLMMLAAGPGTVLELVVTGPEAEAALDALADLVLRKFDED